MHRGAEQEVQKQIRVYVQGFVRGESGRLKSAGKH